MGLKAQINKAIKSFNKKKSDEYALSINYLINDLKPFGMGSACFSALDDDFPLLKQYLLCEIESKQVYAYVFKGKPVSILSSYSDSELLWLSVEDARNVRKYLEGILDKQLDRADISLLSRSFEKTSIKDLFV